MVTPDDSALAFQAHMTMYASSVCGEIKNDHDTPNWSGVEKEHERGVQKSLLDGYISCWSLCVVAEDQSHAT